MIDNVRYAVGEIASNYDDRWWWRQRFQDHVVGRLQRAYYDGGVEVMERDWDNLIVIDACRADLFEEAVDVDRFDDFRVVAAKGSATPEWMEHNFSGGSFGDTVYVSGNPWINKKAPGAFYEIVNIWLEDYSLEEEELSEAYTLREVGIDPGATIPAERVNEAALEALSDHDDKRHIVHYLQPHAPYIGNPDGTRKDPDKIPTNFHPGKPLKEGKVDRDEVWAAYRDNLHYVLHHVWELVEQIDGRTVVTSDHGEMFGEWLWPFPMRGYDHPIGLRAPEVVDVPWAVVEGDSRRAVTEEGTMNVEYDEDVVNDRLRGLGYRE